MIILIGGNKGSAKSTLTLNLATYLSKEIAKTEVIDGDPQKSITNWFESRKENYSEKDIYFNVIHKTGTINNFIAEREKINDFILVDVAGYNSSELSSAMLIADILITPFETSQFSLDTLNETTIQEQSIRKINKDLIIRSLQTRATTIHNVIKKDREMFVAFCDAYNIKPLKTIIYERRIWKNVSYGRSIFDFNTEPAIKAQDEVKCLANEILKLLNIKI